MRHGTENRPTRQRGLPRPATSGAYLNPSLIGGQSEPQFCIRGVRIFWRLGPVQLQQHQGNAVQGNGSREPGTESGQVDVQLEAATTNPTISNFKGRTFPRRWELGPRTRNWVSNRVVLPPAPVWSRSLTKYGTQADESPVAPGRSRPSRTSATSTGDSRC